MYNENVNENCEKQLPVQHNAPLFSIIPANVMFHKEISSVSKLVYGVIAGLCNEKGYCYANNHYLSELFGVSKKTVSRSVSQLSSVGLVNVELIYDGKEVDERRIYMVETSPHCKNNDHNPMDKTVHTPMDKSVQDNIHHKDTIEIRGKCDSESNPDLRPPASGPWNCDAHPNIKVNIPIPSDVKKPEPEPKVDVVFNFGKWPDLEHLDPEDHMRRFMERFEGHKTYQTFADPGNDPSLTRVIKTFPGVRYDLESLNWDGAGIFLTINETDGNGRTAKNITRVRAVFADFDGVPLGDVKDYKPHMIIESSPGKYHAYWLCDDVPLEAFRQLQESIAAKFGSDPKVKDLPRVMRIPGFFHQKDKPFMTQIIHEAHHPKFTFFELTEMFPPTPREQWSKPKKDIVHHHPNTNEAEFRGAYGAPAGQRNDSLIRAIGGMIKRGLPWDVIEDEAYKHGRACLPPLDDAEIAQTLRSGARYRGGDR